MTDLSKSAFPACHVRALVGLLLLLILGQPFQSASAQDVAELYRGTWQVETPNDGALIILLKGKGLAAYFWGDNADRTVYPGEWAADENGAIIEWANGRSHSLQRSPTGFTATARDRDGQLLYDAAVRQLPEETLGQWAKPPTKEDEMRSQREQAEGFFGIWKIGSDAPDYVFVESDRSAASTHGASPRGQRGQWAKQGSELHLIWDSGEYSILQETERGFTYRQIRPGQIIEADDSPTRPAIRTIESRVPADWMKRYQAEREDSTGGIAFSSRGDARAFYRGEWLIKRGEERFERVSLSRFGGLDTSVDRSLDGQWRLSGQDVFMRWDDGMRKILSPVGHGFVLYEYRPGRPLDGVPNRVFAAAPADSSKFAEHLEDRARIAKKMEAMAEAAGIDPTEQESPGWGRSFARWVWPFEGDEGEAGTEAIRDGEDEDEAAGDPWWWPFWSEEKSAPDPETTQSKAANPENEATAVRKTTAPTEEQPAAPANTAAENETRHTQPDKRKSTAKDWLWPF